MEAPDVAPVQSPRVPDTQIRTTTPPVNKLQTEGPVYFLPTPPGMTDTSERIVGRVVDGVFVGNLLTP